MTRVTGAEAMRRTLLEEGVEVMFGHPGGAILPFYDALHGTDGPHHVLVRHEQAAAHAADGYARATGRVGVCVATSGPGATNLVTGLATALMDGVPMVAITGQVPTSVLGRDAFQETDILGVTMPVTKHGFLAERAEDLPGLIRKCFRIAASGRPGPVLIDVPKDVQQATMEIAPASGGAGVERGPLHLLPVQRIVEAVDRLAGAERPLLMVGRGVVLARASDALRELVDATQLPVVTTLLGLDAFPSTDPCALGMPGMHGTERANRAIQEADLIIGLGVRFDDRVTGRLSSFAPNADVVHFDVDPKAIRRTVRPSLAVIGDLARTLPVFVEDVTRRGIRTSGAWWDRVGEWARAAEEEPLEADPMGGLTGRVASRALAAELQQTGATVCTDVGQHQMWLAQELLDAAPGTHITSGGLGTMGFALPAAIGAAMGRPDRPTWAVVGDGGFQMTLQELATVAQEALPLRIAIVNNGSLGMVRQWQEIVFEERYVASALTGPDFVRLAEAYGIQGEAVSRADEIGPALARARDHRGAYLLDLRVPERENVFPMLTPGSALDQMIHASPRTLVRRG